MSNDPGRNYSFDPFGADGQKRWNRLGGGTDLPNLPNYEVIDQLGSGGMGAVWSARYLPLNQVRAVKVLESSLAADPSFIARFDQEAKALGKLQHPNIVRVFDANAHNNPPFIAMQWVEGITLAERLQKRELDIDEALVLFDQIAAALDYAHSLGFVHRDIKPSNVMVTDKGQAMLIDFGVANFLGYDASTSSTITGTTRYLAPEVIQGRLATASSDIWAFAVLMYRVLAGHLPFDGGGPDSILKKIVTEAPAEPERVNPKVARCLLDALQKEPTLRAKTATELVKRLRGVAKHQLPVVGKEKVAVSAAVGLIGVVAVAVVLGLGAFVFSVLSRPKETTKTITKIVPAPKGSQLPPSASATAAVNDLRGAWFGDLGTRWVDVMLTPGSGRDFQVTVWTRDQNGVEPTTGTGKLSQDGKSMEFDLPSTNVSFKGNVSEGMSSLVGTFGSGNLKLVRAADLTTSESATSQDGFVVRVPTGWTMTVDEADGVRSTTFSPYGEPSVALRVVLSSEEAKTIGDVFAAREQGLIDESANGGDYKRLSLTDGASFAGRTAMLWEFRQQRATQPVMHGLFYGMLHGSWALTVESWSPADQDSLWGPVLERMRHDFKLNDG